MVNFYEVAGVSPTATKEQIKKAYRKLVVKVHPDKNRGDPEATSKFQALQHIFEILLDEEKRKIYDETGEDPDSEESLGKLSPEDILKFCRKHFNKVTKESIIEFEKRYRGSKEEEEDLKKFYKKFEGNLERILYYIICCDESDISRFVCFYDACISHENAERHAAVKERQLDPLDTFETENCATNDNDSLSQMILSKQKKREAAFDTFCNSILNKAKREKKKQ
eukprot:jgi/Galph1/2395/GphlegSOOS_G1048.1